tara:strand:- start:1076 stop:1285 length:210 start_codon:yes stop_codon:yes gene_type:complete
MTNITNSINPPTEELCNFLLYKLGIDQNVLELGIKRCYLENSPLPIVMWSYGLITISQLNIILIWLKDN